MKKIVLTFGLISGVILAAMMALTIPMLVSGKLDWDTSEVLGYTSMVLAFLTIFFGIRSYRETIGGGVVTFKKAFQVGILITLITSTIYVASWQVIYYNFIPNFGEVYGAHVVEKMRAEGANQAAIEVKQQEMARFSELYANPFFNVAITYMEIFPLGLVVTLISAAILRRKSAPGAEASAPSVA